MDRFVVMTYKWKNNDFKWSEWNGKTMDFQGILFCYAKGISLNRRSFVREHVGNIYVTSPYIGHLRFFHHLYPFSLTFYISIFMCQTAQLNKTKTWQGWSLGRGESDLLCWSFLWRGYYGS
jgi:hypothetical protein